jgi:hypothetical protein
MGARVAQHVKSNAVAWLALFLAVGGASYAAVRLPANSVGSRQLRRNAVTSSKVKNHSLLKVDFRPGQLPRGATGPAGPKGAAGPTGPTGPSGPVGPSNASEVEVAGPVAVAAGATATVATLSGLAPGAYAISAKAEVENPGAGDGESRCTLAAGDQSDASEEHVHNAPAAGQTHSTMLTQTFGATGSATLTCTPAGQGMNYLQAKIVAVRLGSETHATG